MIRKSKFTISSAVVLFDKKYFVFNNLSSKVVFLILGLFIAKIVFFLNLDEKVLFTYCKSPEGAFVEFVQELKWAFQFIN